MRWKLLAVLVLAILITNQARATTVVELQPNGTVTLVGDIPTPTYITVLLSYDFVHDPNAEFGSAIAIINLFNDYGPGPLNLVLQDFFCTPVAPPGCGAQPRQIINGVILVSDEFRTISTSGNYSAIHGSLSIEISALLPDGVSIAPAIPESSTWAMLLIGFAGIGFLTMRRRQALRT
jgi:hypothetical protein